MGYTLNGAGSVTFTVKLKSAGRKVRGKCVAPTTPNKRKPRCARLTDVRGKLVKILAALELNARVESRERAG